MKGQCVHEGKCHVPLWAAWWGHATMEANLWYNEQLTFGTILNVAHEI